MTTNIDAARFDETRALFDMPLAWLVEQTGAVPLNGAPTQASPLILTGSCSTNPPCRHCKWEHFKAVGRSAFVLDTPLEDLIARAHRLADHGIDRAFTATGWLGYRLPASFVRAVAAIHEAEPRLALYGLFGALDRQSHRDLAAAGLTGMLTSLESPSERVYRSFRPAGDTLADRLASFDHAREAGLKVWTGFLVGLGETADEVAQGIELLHGIDPESVSILPFEPYPDTPMAEAAPCDPAWLARVNAVARLRLPGVAHFFTDHAADFDRFAGCLGLNGSYVTQIR